MFTDALTLASFIVAMRLMAFILPTPARHR